jgi:hypothetical protein
MKKITQIVGAAGAELCDRSRSAKLRVLEIARAARAKGNRHQDRLRRAYGQLLNSTGRVVGQAKRFSEERRTAGDLRDPATRRHTDCQAGEDQPARCGNGIRMQYLTVLHPHCFEGRHLVDHIVGNGPVITRT